MAVTDALPVDPLQIPLGAVIVAFGSAFTPTVALAVPLQLLLFVTVTPRVTGPEAEVNVTAFVPAPLVIVPLAIVHAYDAPVMAAVEALPVAPAQMAGGALIDSDGLVLTVTVTPPECDVQPDEFVTVTEYVPFAPTVIDCAWLPSLQVYPDIPAGAESVTLPPWQNVVGPFGVMMAEGNGFTAIVCCDVAVHPAAVVTVTLRTTDEDPGPLWKKATAPFEVV
jgi:hypothetical protein